MVDLGISLTLHTAGVFLLFEREWVSASIVLGMASLWQIGCYGIKRFERNDK